MVKPIVQIGVGILTQECRKISDFKSPELKQVINDLIDTADDKRSATAGLAAPQIGSDLAVCICRRVDLEIDSTKKLDKNTLWEPMVNPKVVKASKSNSVFWEACMSIGVGPNALFGPVERPEKIVVEYQTPTGDKKQISADDFFSHEIQHEIDHLHGILFLKYVTNPHNIWKKQAIDQYFKEYGDYPPVE